MNLEVFMREDFLVLPPVHSYEELDNVPEHIRYALAYDASRPNPTNAYYYFYEDGKWSKDSQAVATPEDINLKIHANQAWNGALTTFIDHVKAYGRDSFTVDEIVEMLKTFKKV
jgi:hypothetical protein